MVLSETLISLTVSWSLATAAHSLSGESLTSWIGRVVVQRNSWKELSAIEYFETAPCSSQARKKSFYSTKLASV